MPGQSSTERFLKRDEVRITRNCACRLGRAGSVKTDFKEKVLESKLCFSFCNPPALTKTKTEPLYYSVRCLFLELAILFYLQKMLSQERLNFVILLLCSVLFLANKSIHTHGVRCSLRCTKPKLRQGEIYSKCHVSYPLKLNCSVEEISLQLQNVSFL